MEITAPRNFSPGEVICTEKPFIKFLSRKFKDVACESCFERVPNLKYCKECLNVKYCGKTCQKKNWKDHKLECQNLRNLPSEDTMAADKARIIGNLILKIKGKDWTTIKSSIMGIDVSFDDTVPNSEYIQGHYAHIYDNATKENVRRYIGDQNMPNEDDFKKISGKVVHSISADPHSLFRMETKNFYIGLSLIQVECIPNCRLTKENDNAVLKAIKKIEKSEKLSVNKDNVLDSPPPVAGMNICNCTDCKLPYGESVLSKIIDEQRALEVIIKTEHFINHWKCFPFVRSMPQMIYLVDDLLQKQEGVLGDTNALHLKLLTIKCFDIGGHPLEMKKSLLKLEKNVVAVFGEYYPALGRIYESLADIFFSIGNISKGMHYTKKIECLVSAFQY